jgi:UDP-2,3-diacylglucosamine pyrophosphatase LpxH
MLIFLGDLHSNFNNLRWYIENKKITDATIIQVGDFGIGFNNDKVDNQLLQELNIFLNQKNTNFFAIRGNHDNPKYFKGNHLLSNLKLLPDYSVITVDDWNILLVGGAISVDRIPRIKENGYFKDFNIDKQVYWQDEIFTYNDDNKNFINNLKNIDIVVTHTAPSKCNPDNSLGFNRIVDSFARTDSDLKNDLIEERKLADVFFSDLLSNNDIRYHFYGHFHFSNIDSFGRCSHILLDVGEFYQFR